MQEVQKSIKKKQNITSNSTTHKLLFGYISSLSLFHECMFNCPPVPGAVGPQKRMKTMLTDTFSSLPPLPSVPLANRRITRVRFLEHLLYQGILLDHFILMTSL